MRVTTKIISQSLLTNLNNNLGKLQEYQDQLSSGKRLNSISDDPAATARLLTAKSAMQAQEQYNSNMDYAGGWLDTADNALDSAGQVLQRATEIAVMGANGALNKESMQALGDEMDTLVAEMVQIGNTNYAGRYIFGGGNSATSPFTISGQDSDGKITTVQFIDPAYTQDKLGETYSQKIEIASGVTIDISVGRKTFHSSSGADDMNAIFKTMIKLREDLDNQDTNQVGSDIGLLEDQSDNILSERATIGAKSNRVELAQSRATIYSTNLTKLVSDLEDADIAEAATKYSSQQATYQAALSVGAKIIMPSLLDFLK